MTKAVQLISLLVIGAIGLAVGVQVFLDTAEQVTEKARTNSFNATGNDEAAGDLENLTATGKTVASFVPLMYIVLPLALVGGAAAGLVLVGRRLIG